MQAMVYRDDDPQQLPRQPPDAAGTNAVKRAEQAGSAHF